MKTTLNAIRAHNPRADVWRKLLSHLNKTEADNEPLSIIAVLDSNGLDDTLWTLRAVTGHDREIRRYVVWCARQAQHLMTDPRSIAALDVVERYANGLATDAELDAARAAANAAANAARAAANAAANAARAAANEAANAARAAGADRGQRIAAAETAEAAAETAEAAAWAAEAAAADTAEAAGIAAGAAAWYAARAARYAAWYAARDARAARDAARDAQAARLRELCAALEEAK